MIRSKITRSIPMVRSWLAYAALPAAGIVTAPILAHALGPSGRGQLAGILQPLAIAGALAAFGVPSAVTFFTGRLAASGAIWRLALKTLIWTLTGVTLGLIYYSKQISANLGISRTEILLVWSTFAPTAIIAVWRGQVQGRREYFRIDRERALIAALRVAIILLLWLIGCRSVIIFAACYMVPGLLAAVTLRRSTISGTNTDENRTNDVVAMNGPAFVKFALLSGFGTIAATMSARLDQAILPAAVSAADLGLYSVAVAVAEIPAIITMVASRNIFAEASASVKGSALVRSALIGGVVQFGLILSIIVALPHLIPVIFGIGFVSSLPLVEVLLLGSFVGYWGSVGSAYLTGAGMPGIGSAGQAMSALLTVVLFYKYWDEMTVSLAAWVSVISQLSALTLVGVLFLFIRNRSPKAASDSDPRLARMPRPLTVFDPPRLWTLSCWLHQRGYRRIARLIKVYLFLVFRAALPPEAILSGEVGLGHWGMNIVIHPNVTLGKSVMIWHNVTLSVSDSPGAASRLSIGNRVTIGTGAVVVTPYHESLDICDDVVIGANAVVTRSIVTPGTYVGSPAKRVSSARELRSDVNE